jgi:serine/threonine-protein kinase
MARIGAGGMGEVWKARDARLDRIVAVKLVHGQDPGRFEREARAIAALNHPNICQIYDVGPDHLVMEYINGKAPHGPMAEDVAIDLGIQVASALDEAHRRGIIHRDLKPGNILVTNDGVAKLLDFGLAKSVKDTDLDSTVTMAGTILGTTAYMSPEQASGKPLDARSDIFSFGSVLYELLSGRRAFDGTSVTDVLTRVLRDDPPALETRGSVSNFVFRCLAKQPSLRFQTFAEAKVELEKLRPRAKSIEPSIAVLPFANMSSDKDNEYFSDGVTEEIINALAHVPGLKVTARTSAFAFRGKEQDIRKIAAILGVRTVLEGSVRRAGNRVRVTAQLIDAEDGYHLWSERYDREMSDIFAMQDEIAEAIAAALKIKLSSSSAPKRYVPGLPAYEALLKARHESAKFTPESLLRSREYYEQAIALDPAYALPHSELSLCLLLHSIAGTLPAHAGMPRVREGAIKALAIDPNLPDAHAVLGSVAALYDYNWTEAERHFRRAMAQEPVSLLVRQAYAVYFLFPAGRTEAALREIDRNVLEDPLFLPTRYSKAMCLIAAGKMEEAEQTHLHCLEQDPSFFPALGGLALLSATRGDYQKALEYSEKIVTLAAIPPYIGAHAGVLMRLGESRRAQEFLARLKAPSEYPVPIALALFHFQLGEIDKMADWIEKAIEQRYPLIPSLLRGPLGAALRQTPRWAQLARLVRLPGTP